MTRATVVEWLARENEPVSAGAPLVEIETDKAVVTIDAQQSGVLRRIVVPVGRKVPVGTPIGVIASAEEDVDSLLSEVVSPSNARATAAATVGEYDVPDYSDALLGFSRNTTYTRSRPTSTLKAQGRHREADRRQAVLVLGAGRHAAEIIDALLANEIAVHGCLDARLPVGTEVYPGVRVVGADNDVEAMTGDGFDAVYLGIGGLDNLDARIDWFKRLESLGVLTPALIHPSAHVAPSATIGEGSCVLARASIGPLSRVGRGCMITQSAVITHHCRLGDYVMLAPNATLAAGVEIDDEATIGMGVTVFHDVRIGRRALIVNGVDLMHDVPAGQVVKWRDERAIVRSRGAGIT